MKPVSLGGMATVKTTVTYMEMLAPPSTPPLAPPEPGLTVRKVSAPAAERYLEWYDKVGRDLTWTGRKLMPRSELQDILDDPGVEVSLLETAKGTAGYFELDRRVARQVELSYFGLFPEARGRKLGPFLLDRAIRAAWSGGPRRVWVHTCTLDDPRALPLYQRLGFVVYGTGEEEVELLS